MTPNFRKLVAGAVSGEVLVPVIRNYLWDPKFPSFTINIDGWKPRPPDGWFHPSTHPLVPERLLYYYLTEPTRMIPEVFDPTSTMTVTQGHFWHEFIQTCLLDAGILQANPADTGRNPAEWLWFDEETRARGWSDGLTLDGEIFEFKSMRQAKAAKIANGAPDSPEVQQSFRDLVPGYYAQAQEYMRLSGRKRWRGVVLSLEWPFPLREVVLDFDPFFAHQIATKYRSVLQAAADQRPPMPCCGGGKIAAACPARAVCPMGGMR